MNFFKRAIKNVSRSLTKSILLIITFFVIGNFVIIGLGISSASENAKTLTRKKMRAVVTYNLDYDALWKYEQTLTDQDEIDAFYENYPRIRLADVKEILKDERIKAANTLYSRTLYGKGLDFVHLNNTYEQERENQNFADAYYYEEGNFFVKGNSFVNMIEFMDGEYWLVEGRFYTQEEIDDAINVVVISKELANQNGLRVGDHITLALDSVNNYKMWEENLNLEDDFFNDEYEIIGLFDTEHRITRDSSMFDYCMPYENPLNMIFAPTTSLYRNEVEKSALMFDKYAEIYPDDEYYTSEEYRPSYEKIDDLYISDITLLLNDPLEVDKFIEDYEGGLKEFTVLDANNEEFERLSKPLDTLNLYSTFVVWLVVINAIVIITLVVALTLKTREYEIGVLLSIGASKFKIIAQFFVELALVAILGFTLAVGSGSIVSSKIGDRVLEYQIQQEDVEDDFYVDDGYSVWNEDYTTSIELEDLINEYHVSISPIIILEIYAMGLMIVLISIVIPSMMIMRFNPKKILMNQL